MPPEQAFSEFSSWYRRQYIIEQIDGIPVIVPILGSGINRYNPLKEEELAKRPKKAKDQDKSAPHIALLRLDLSDTNAILDFVNKWGLLGLWKVSQYQEAKGLPQKSSYIINGRFSEWYLYPEESGSYARQEPLPLFIKAAKEYKEIINDLDCFHENKEPTIDRDENKVFCDAEPENFNEINDFIDESEDDPYPFSSDNDDKTPVTETKESCALILRLQFNERLEGVRPGIVWKDEWTPYWHFNSLLDAIYLKVFIDLQGNKIFRRCKKKQCNKFFLGTHPENQYCSEACRTSHLVKTHRERKWKEGLLQKYNTIDGEWLSEHIDYSFKQGISGEKKLEEHIKKLIDTLDLCKEG